MYYSIEAMNYFLRGDLSNAVYSLYRKDKNIIVKKNECHNTLTLAKQIEQTLKDEQPLTNIREKLDTIQL